MREEENKPTSKKSIIRRILNKRWALPAIYIASAALILAGAIWAQNSFNDSADKTPDKEEAAGIGNNMEEPAVEVNSHLEIINMPVTDSQLAVIKKEFYDKDADKEKRAAALVFYNNRVMQNKGLDIAAKDGGAFDVVASLSGKVSKVKEDSLLGNEVEIEHENGVITRYQSITDITVEVGDKVKQGAVIAKAGRSLLNEEAGTHVHFEIRQNDVALNPNAVFGSQLTSLETKDEAADKNPSSVSEEEDASNSDSEAIENPADSKSSDDDHTKEDPSDSENTEEG
ncbi:MULTISPECIES: M23 family metallopeptidase [Bacillaceae]|uniref:Stage II sporulation protein Q n=1 Tax=Peribacillus huizhouensis TaxID=1501239 RepID=A0ABR6CSC3_9BACI|nr:MULTISPECIES: M23 family metallopeptidase [Bacillaceae]MBA9027860.1 stage II sporulation protein Q [Peribacillus huizhouensis]